MTNSLERTLEGAAEQPRGKRQRLITAASQLLHQQGVEKTTLADIAQTADVPAGNVYYYFKTKDDIIAAVIEAHVQQAKAALASIDSGHRSPKSRRRPSSAPTQVKVRSSRNTDAHMAASARSWTSASAAPTSQSQN